MFRTKDDEPNFPGLFQEGKWVKVAVFCATRSIGSHCWILEYTDEVFSDSPCPKTVGLVTGANVTVEEAACYWLEM